MYKLLSENNTNINIDCIKKCPLDHNLFAFSFYQQLPQFQGGIAVKSIKNQKDLAQIDMQQYGPMLHICWLEIAIKNGCYILAAACRIQKVIIFAFNPQNQNLVKLKEISIVAIQFCLYLDIIHKAKQGAYQMIVSTNESTVYSFELDDNFTIQNTVKHSKHQYAVWACRYNQFMQNTFACGDEVNSIYLYQKDCLIGKNSISQQQGICDLVFVNEWTLLSGGFDGMVCQFDIRYFSNKAVNRYQYGGTIWRIIPDQKKEKLLLCNSSENKFEVVDRYTGKSKWNSEKTHNSLAYASDWNENLLITASFYDKKHCCWYKSLVNNQKQ